jgi:hypothetical protein
MIRAEVQIDNTGLDSEHISGPEGPDILAGE